MSELTFQPGTRVRKYSGKPFKSRSKVNTIRGFQTNPFTGRPAANFFEDDSVVELQKLFPDET